MKNIEFKDNLKEFLPLTYVPNIHFVNKREDIMAMVPDIRNRMIGIIYAIHFDMEILYNKILYNG